MTNAQHTLLWAIQAGEVSRRFPMRGEPYYDLDGEGRITAAVEKVMAAGWATCPPPPFGTFRPMRVVLTEAGREALRR